MEKLQTGIGWMLLPFFFLGFAWPGTGLQNKIAGVYWSPQKDAKIEIYMQGQLFYGKPIWVAKPGKDINNPSKTLQARDLPGIELL